MDVGERVGPIIKEDFLKQDIGRLESWIQRFPDACLLLEAALGESCLKYAMRENLWLSSVFLLQCDSVPRKTLQIQTCVENQHETCLHLVRSHVQNSPSSQSFLASHLYSLVRL